MKALVKVLVLGCFTHVAIAVYDPDASKNAHLLDRIVSQARIGKS
jgi:hypothetical protein